MIDAGLRISEDAGLLFDSLRAIDTSQGTLYYVEITGQLSPSGKRTEITKTDSSYRTVPISYELAQDLVRYRQKLEETHGDLSLRLLCGQGEEDGFNDSPAKAAAWQERISKLVPQLLRLYLNYCGRKIYPGLSHQPVPTVSAKRHRISLYVTGQLVMPCGAISAHGYTARAASTLLKSIDRWDIAMAPSRKRQPV